MFSIAYLNTTKKLILARMEVGSAPLESPQQQLELHCEMNDLDPADYTALEIPYDKKLRVVLGNHVFNEVTGKIEEDPNYVEPTPPAQEPTV